MSEEFLKGPWTAEEDQALVNLVQVCESLRCNPDFDILGSFHGALPGLCFAASYCGDVASYPRLETRVGKRAEI